jgi:hypothetical protein
MRINMANEEYQIPIFLINGQLDSGKTRFISDTIAMGQFADAKNKLLIVCEEGEEEYSEKLLKDNGVDMVVVEKAGCPMRRQPALPDPFYSHILPWHLLM